MTLSREVLAAARKLGLQLQIVEASNERELDDAFKSLLHLQADGLVIGPNTFLGTQYERLAALTVRHSVPAIYQFRGFAEAGGLMSYGTFHTDSYRAAGVYTGKILRGAHPGDLPVQQPNRFELIINLKAAKALGLTVPVMMFARANEVIE
jgi:putative ABC transport system substrate-binding protein